MLSYSRKVALTDAGAFVSQLILHLPEIVAAGTVTPETFSVFVKRSNRTTGEAIHLARRMPRTGCLRGIGKSGQSVPVTTRGGPWIAAIMWRWKWNTALWYI